MSEQQQVSPWQVLLLACLIMMMTPLWHPSTACQAQIITDGSLGPGVPLPGPNYQIPADVGQIRGSNLFHSFEQFNIYADETATFTGPDTISNILSRVTGGNPSNIFGELRSEIPGANFFLLNPNGVIFGPGALLNVGGSFHVSTADVLALQDQGTFHSNLGQNSVLTTAAPAAFGFLSSNPAAIRVEGGRLAVSAGESISIVAGGVALSPTNNRTTSSGVLAPGGQIQLLSVSSPGNLSWNTTGELVPEDPAMLGGDITVEASGRISVADTSGGRITLLGGDIRIDEGIIDAQVEGNGSAGSIRLDGDDIKIDNLSQLTGGQLTLMADHILIDDGSRLDGEVLALAAKDIEITGKRRANGDEVESQLNGRQISMVADDTIAVTDDAEVNSLGRGAENAGSIMVTARELKLDSDARLRTNAIRNSSGNAGVITIRAEIIAISDGAQISSTTQGSGNGGQVIVIDAQELSIDDGQLQASALEDSTGAAGQITIAADRVMVTNDGGIQSVTMGTGDAGKISISADWVEVTDSGHLRVRAQGESIGAAGEIDVVSDRLLLDRARIDSSAQGPGDAGTITIRSDEVSILNQTRLFVNARDKDPGSGGEVTIEAKQIAMSGGSRIDNSTAGSGDAGTITMMAEQIELSDDARLITNTRSDSSGNGGRITLQADTILVTEDARVESDTRGEGHAGEIVMTNIRQVTVSDGGRVSASALSNSSGNAGRVHIEASESILVNGAGSRIQSRAVNDSNGGLITLITPLLTVADVD